MLYWIAQGSGYKYKRFSLEPDEKEHAGNSRDKPHDVGIPYCLYKVRIREAALLEADIHGKDREDKCYDGPEQLFLHIGYLDYRQKYSIYN